MATDKPRFTITLDPDTLDQVLEFKCSNHLSTQSKAIQRLIELGIRDTMVKHSAPAPLTSDEAQLISDYRDASKEIREEAAAMLHRSAERCRQENAGQKSSAG